MMIITSFPYSKTYQMFTTLKIELHGETGKIGYTGSSTKPPPGVGGFLEGLISLNGLLEIESINGGSGGYSSPGSGGVGGKGLVLKHKNNLKAVVSGGGGSGRSVGSDDWKYSKGGNGGGLQGSNADNSGLPHIVATGATQNSSGLGGVCYTTDGYEGADGQSGSYLQGGNGAARVSNTMDYEGGGGGGGAGYYGGGGGYSSAYNSTAVACGGGGAGGSSYIAGLKNASTITGGSDGTLKAVITELAVGNPQSLGFSF